MNLPIRSATLIALAAGIFAADGPVQQPVMSALKDNDLKITIGGQLQARGEWSQSKNSADQPYDIASGTDNRKSDDLDLYMRRVRLFVNGSYGDYTFKLGMRADNADRKGNDAATASSQRGFEIHYASVTRAIKAGDITHSVQVGLDYPFFNSASYGNSAAQLTAADRSTVQLLAPRGAGIGYRLNAPIVYVGADVQNNTKTVLGTNNGVTTGLGDSATPSDSAQYQSEGLCYTARAEFTPHNEWEIKPKDFKESFAGKEGKGAVMAIESGYNQHDLVAAQGAERARWHDVMTIGTEALVHIDALTALAEYRWTRQTTNTDRGEPNDTSAYANILIVQAGYAVPCLLIPGAVVEPIARYTKINLDRDNTNESNPYGNGGAADYATSSGNQYEIGANWYLNGVGQYSNKVSLLYAHWIGEDTGATVNNSIAPKADIIRVQYQFLF